MHRDVYRGYFFIMSLNPIQAVLGDVDKTIQTEHDSYEHPSLAHNCAPEIGGTHSYDNRIDIWSFGVAMLEILGKYHPAEGRPM